MGLDDVVGHPPRALVDDEVAEGVEPRARRRVEHGVHRARLGIDQDRRHLRIVDVALFYGERSGGIRTYLDAKARHARATGAFEHHVVVPGPRERHRDGRHELPSLRLAAANGYRLPLGVGALKRTLERLRPHVVLLHDPFWAPLHVTEAAHTLGARVVAVHHGSAALDAAGMRGPRRPWEALFRAWLRRAYAPVDAIASVVDPEPDCGREASFPLRLGLHEAFRPQTGVERGDHVLYVGRLAREKGVFRLLEAAARSDDPWPLRLIGSGPAEDRLRRRAQALGMARRVSFQPFVSDRARLARAYAGARCVVMPGEHETFGLVALEAAASGARVVACATAPSAGLLDGIAHTFAAGDAHDLAAAIAGDRAAHTDPAAAASLCWRLGWDRLFAAELDDLQALAA
jgi:alpha-1,6-mannosyltransferase